MVIYRSIRLNFEHELRKCDRKDRFRQRVDCSDRIEQYLVAAVVRKRLVLIFVLAGIGNECLTGEQNYLHLGCYTEPHATTHSIVLKNASLRSALIALAVDIIIYSL